VNRILHAVSIVGVREEELSEKRKKGQEEGEN
jgi:hypothetical protein